jgi:hypothetical protein
MPIIDVAIVHRDSPPPWPDAGPLTEASDLWRLAALSGGMESGDVSIALLLDTPSGQVVAQTSLAAWIAATCAVRGAFPEAFAGTPLEAARG